MRFASLLMSAAAGSLMIGAAAAHAAEGMWTLDNLPVDALGKTYGFAPDAAWIAKVMHASVRLENGCSGSFVSPAGLVMTNHHCVEDCVGQLSTPRHDLMRGGFLAPTAAAERRCPGLALDRLDGIVDVTGRVAAAGRGLAGPARLDARRAEIARITAACAGAGKAVRCDVVDLYQGAVHHLYRYRRFDDVRLVFAPEADAAQFGGDPDNFNFPRYDIDLGIVRAYEDGRPVRGNEFFRFSRAGAEAGELTITSGHPGSTQRQLTVAQLERVRDVDDPWRLTRLAEQRGLITRFSAESAENARIARGTLDDIENAYKAYYGELESLRDPAVLARKRADESELRALAAQRAELRADDAAWDEIAAAQQTFRDIAMRYRFTEGGQGLWTDYFDIARALVRAADERAKADAERLPEFTDAALASTEQKTMSPAIVPAALERVKLSWSLTKLREWLGADDPLVERVLGRESPEALARRWISATRLGDVAYRARLWRGGKAAIEASDDPFVRVARLLEPESRRLRARLDAEVTAIEHENAEKIARVRFARTGTGAYPDATFTLRLSFGTVQGWNDHGRPIGPFTTVAGWFGRSTGQAPFRLPPSWLAAKRALAPGQRVNFTSSNDIVGGNSGSPVLDRRAEIVGLVFDGNLESLGGTFWWDEAHNRTVAVDGALILQALDKVYHATALLDEIEPPR
ncbi:MAG: S46 family peptidase [Burkholderiaceae bacterium]